MTSILRTLVLIPFFLVISCGTNFNATTLVNILWGWLMPVGFLIDAATGSLSTWDESGIHVKLVPLKVLSDQE